MLPQRFFHIPQLSATTFKSITSQQKESLIKHRFKVIYYNIFVFHQNKEDIIIIYLCSSIQQLF